MKELEFSTPEHHRLVHTTGKVLSTCRVRGLGMAATSKTLSISSFNSKLRVFYPSEEWYRTLQSHYDGLELNGRVTRERMRHICRGCMVYSGVDFLVMDITSRVSSFSWAETFILKN